MVQAPMGSQAEQLMQRSAGQATLADLYRDLHPGARYVPQELQDISDRLEAEKRLSPPAPPPPEEDPAEALSKAAASAGFPRAGS